ncbi:alcohol dehydrogenase catalytic domain-containing protein [Alkalibaculum sp. M08DMB]|uniref:Alcohol dehydrogenase catalytic domain-containing protein n=1 Tax=Alkalibaculum sporogenes TaxID=2655001 RepID=A0A6A7KAR4_9FIRM|nr:zinc-binding dehydrogenase [Alkalibaculum sporogenes]MPW26133.1 alcohol dehydrogenase catalytic domain-containing protein [Alkalibaculum sporogenes]
MKAVVKTASGYDNMELMEVVEPVAIGNLVKIKIAYSGVCGTDLHAFSGVYSSTKAPVILGHEFSGVVTEIGPQVKTVKVGDRVTSETTYTTCGKCEHCISKDYNLCSNREGLGTQVNGSMAQYTLSREESIHVLPENVSLLSAALTEPLACSVHASIEKANIQRGDLICIFGVGAIGLLLAQVAKSKGAYVILAGLTSDVDRLEIGKKIGVDRTVDQMKENINDIVQKITKGVGLDVVFECSGAVAALNKGIEIVKKKGKIIQMGVFPESKMNIATDLILNKEITYIGSRSQKPSSWVKSIKLLKDGVVDPEIIVTKIVSIEQWREAFQISIKGEGVKSVIKCNDEF